MSADIASLPSWKIALLERKRRQEKEPGVTSATHTSGIGASDGERIDDGLPTWKRDILAKKYNQKNTFVFTAKPLQSDKTACEASSGLLNGHVPTDTLCNGTIEPELDNLAVDIDVGEVVGDPPLEERLLPIHQNPILRLDLQKRQQTSSGSVRSSLSPRQTSSSAIAHEQPVNVEPPATPEAENEVFGNNNESETDLAYGRGFVHKLLMRFSHLSSSDQAATPSARSSKQRLNTPIDASRLSASTSRSRSSQDLESITQTKSPSGMPTAKYHSFDDLLSEAKFQVRPSNDDSGDELEITRESQQSVEPSSHQAGVDSSVNVVAVEDSSTELSSNSALQGSSEGLPLANIVSNARNLFESLAVHSGTQKRSPSPLPHSSNRFSYVGTIERSHASKNVSSSAAHSATVNKQAQQAELQNLVSKPVEAALQTSGSGLITTTEMSVSTSSDIASANDISSESSHSVVSKTAPPNVDISKEDDRASARRPFFPSRSLNTVESTPPSGATNATCVSDSQAGKTDGLKKISTSETTPITNVDSSVPQTTSWTTSSSTYVPPAEDKMPASSQTSRNNEPCTRNQPETSVKKPAPSRPGKLLIRPASNLVAAKTNAEYLELTKYNDVRKGQFAPPVKKERRLSDSENDKVDANDSIVADEYVFLGAGVVIGRSMLVKTNKGRSLQILFDDSLTETFEYPSEQSLMLSTPAEPGYVDYEGPEDMIHGTGLKTTPSITSAGTWSSYQSKMQTDYQFGMHLKEERKAPPPPVSSKPPPIQPTAQPVASPANDSPVYSKDATPDLLF